MRKTTTHAHWVVTRKNPQELYLNFTRLNPVNFNKSYEATTLDRLVNATVVSLASKSLRDGVASRMTNEFWIRSFLLFDRWPTKAEEPGLSYYLPHSWEEKKSIQAFPKSICAKREFNELAGNLNSTRWLQCSYH